MSVSKASMVLQNYQNLIEMTSNIIYIVALAVGLKCPHKIHLNTQCPAHIGDHVIYEWYLCKVANLVLSPSTSKPPVSEDLGLF